MLLKKSLKKKIAVRALPLREFYDKRNRVLVVRNARGIGDILMHRMMFEDFQRVMPDIQLVFACPSSYHDIVRDHPFVSEVQDSSRVERGEFMVSYDTSMCCIQHECASPVETKHRADVWAEHCGVILGRHNMYMPIISPPQIQAGANRIKQVKTLSGHKNATSPNVLFTPIAFSALRTLTDEQIVAVVEHLRKKGCFVYSTHTHDVKLLDDLNVPVLCGYNTHEWLSFIYAADYVVTADTSVFHYAGGIGRPMTGIFTHVDGKYRGKYFDFVLVQKHRDNGDWPCGPCYNWGNCTHPKCPSNADDDTPRPCLTELKPSEILEGINKMFAKWPVKVNTGANI